MRPTGEIAQLIGGIFIRITHAQLLAYPDLREKIHRSVTPVRNPKGQDIIKREYCVEITLQGCPGDIFNQRRGLKMNKKYRNGILSIILAHTS